MKKQYIITSTVVLTILMGLLLMQRGKLNKQMNGTDLSGDSHSGQLPNQAGSDDQNKDGTGPNAGKNATGSTLPGTGGTDGKTDQSAQNAPAKKENDCFKVSYQHQAKNQSRDIEDFLNDTNAFPVNANANQKSICVKVNDKPVNHKFVKKGGKAEVIIGSVVGPESTIQVSYCVGHSPCKESCAVKMKNKVDELISDSEMGGLENAELENHVKELRNVASVNGDLMDSAIIRDWNQLQANEWACAK